MSGVWEHWVFGINVSWLMLFLYHSGVVMYNHWFCGIYFNLFIPIAELICTACWFSGVGFMTSTSFLYLNSLIIFEIKSQNQNLIVHFVTIVSLYQSSKCWVVCYQNFIWSQILMTTRWSPQKQCLWYDYCICCNVYVLTTLVASDAYSKTFCCYLSV